MTTRPSWDDYFLGIAEAVSKRADCTRAQVGAVIVTPDWRIISTGYNGSPPGAASCLAGHCPRGRLSYDDRPAGGTYADCFALHAERNAILYAPQDRLVGAILYITRAPCDDCHGLICAVRLGRVVIPGASWKVGVGICHW